MQLTVAAALARLPQGVAGLRRWGSCRRNCGCRHLGALPALPPPPPPLHPPPSPPRAACRPPAQPLPAGRGLRERGKTPRARTERLPDGNWGGGTTHDRETPSPPPSLGSRGSPDETLPRVPEELSPTCPPPPPPTSLRGAAGLRGAALGQVKLSLRELPPRDELGGGGGLPRRYRYHREHSPHRDRPRYWEPWRWKKSRAGGDAQFNPSSRLASARVGVQTAGG